MGASRYQLATANGDLLSGWSAVVVTSRAGTVRLDARYAASCGGSLRVSVGGLQAVAAGDPPAAGAGRPPALRSIGQGISLEVEAAKVGSVDEALTAGRQLFGCLDSGRFVLVAPCGGSVRRARRRP